MALKECICAQCGKKFEDDVPEIEGHDRVSFCIWCYSSGKYLEEVVRRYKLEHKIPEEETIMVKCNTDGSFIFVKEKDIIEWCKKRGLDPVSYMKRYNFD